MALARAVKETLPRARLIYGGLFPTYNAARAMSESAGAVDFVVAHDAERASADLVDRLDASADEIPRVAGVLSRVASPPRGPLTPVASLVTDLDAARPRWAHAWGLERYRAYGMPSAVVQFSRGCPRDCSFCGQWDFWKAWRHRSVASFADEVAELSRRGVRVFWIADENWSVRQPLFLELLAALRAVNRGHHLIVAMECAHVIRDRPHHRLYAEAGISQIMLGVDGEDEGLLGRSPKRFDDRELPRAIESLRSRGIVSIVNHFAPPGRAADAAQRAALHALRADFYNCLHATPHNWTPYGERAAARIAESDLQRWDYRHPVLGAGRGDLLRQAWQAKALEFRLNAAALRARLAGRRRQTNRLTVLSSVLSGLVFLRELGALVLETAAHGVGAIRLASSSGRLARMPSIRARVAPSCVNLAVQFVRWGAAHVTRWPSGCGLSAWPFSSRGVAP